MLYIFTTTVELSSVTRWLFIGSTIALSFIICSTAYWAYFRVGSRYYSNFEICHEMTSADYSIILICHDLTNTVNEMFLHCS